MSVCFLYDSGNADGSVGGAELTMREFAASAPDQLAELDEAETVVIGNCTQVDPSITEQLRGKKVIRYHNDLARYEAPELREWLERNATHVFTSPLHQLKYGLDGVWPNIPPALDLRRFRPSRQVRRNSKREGAVAVASFQNPNKGATMLDEWAKANGGLVVYGTGPFHPTGDAVDFRGPLDYQKVPEVLWSAETFVHLPTAVEPFGRAIVEAWVAGCEIVTNGLVGARHYIEDDPEALENAAERFWEVVS